MHSSMGALMLKPCRFTSSVVLAISSLALPKKYKEKNNQVVPEAQGKTVCGSLSNWLIMFDNKTSEGTLLCTLSRAQIQLPKISPLVDQVQCTIDSAETKNCVVHKAVLSSAPHHKPGHYIVMIIFGKSKELAYCEVGHKTWTLFRKAGSFYDDIIFHKENFYAVDEYGKVVLCKPDSSPTVTIVTEAWFFWGHKVYLAAIQGELCLVIRYLEDRPHFHHETYCLKVCVVSGKDKGKPVGDLADWIILLGHSHSVALPPNSIQGLRNNCIYFKDDYTNRHRGNNHDIRVFNLEDDRIERLQCCPDDLQHIWKQKIVS